jgi:transposase
MWPRSSHAVPTMTAGIAWAAFPNGCLAMRIRDAFGELFIEDVEFAELFTVEARPAVSPARLALVSVLQFVEGLSDRQAADAVRGRIDWKYALGLELADTGFDASVLREFRIRLVAGDPAERLLHRMLDRLWERDLLASGRQRTDATQVLAAVRELNRLELVTETLRAALEALATVAPTWLEGVVPEQWYDRYGQCARYWRLPTAEAAPAKLAVTVGVDGFALLEAVYAADAPTWLRQVEAVQTLRVVWIQQYYRDRNGLRWRDKNELPADTLAIRSPTTPRPATGSTVGAAGAAPRPTSPAWPAEDAAWSARKE